MDMGVVGDFVGEVSASASSLWLGSVSDSSRTDTSEPGEQAELTASSLVGLEKLQMVLCVGHELCSFWSCLPAGFKHVLLF